MLAVALSSDLLELLGVFAETPAMWGGAALGRELGEHDFGSGDGPTQPVFRQCKLLQTRRHHFGHPEFSAIAKAFRHLVVSRRCG